MKKIVLILVLLCSFQSYSQTYGNEWIHYNQQYYEFDIINDGVHRIDYNTLANAGIPIGSIDPRNIQLFAREKEIPILITGEDDGTFNENEFIEFVAFHNDGRLDSLLYLNPSGYHNPHYSIFNDTLNYFITWNNEIDNKRMSVITDNNFGDYPTSEYIWTETLHLTPTFYWEGRTINQSYHSPFYSILAGWFSNYYGYPSGTLEYQTSLANPFNALGPGIPNAVLKTVSASANNAANDGNPNHHLQVSYGDDNLLLDTIFEGYQVNQLSLEIAANQLGVGATTTTHQVINDLDISTDRNIMAWQSLRYPHQMRPNDELEFYFDVPNNSTGDFHHLHFNAAYNDQGTIYVYGEDGYKIPPYYSGDLLNALIPNHNNQDTKCLLTYPENIHIIDNIQSVTPSGYFTDYSGLSLDSTFVIITHSSLLESANNYAAYRSSDDRDALVVDVDELYNQFGGGVVHHDMSIRRFCDFITDTWDNEPEHLFLLGKSIQHHLGRNNPAIFNTNLVPTFGFPGSDNGFTAGLNETLLEPLIPTGRLSANSNDQVNNYLNKVTDFENQEPAEWMKHVMHFGGGSNETEQTLFNNFLNSYRTTIEDTCFGGTVHTFLKNSSLPIEVVLSDSISDRIADGTSILTFFGHASGNSFDYSIDDPENLEWNQHYPLFIGNSCFTGNIHLPEQNSTSEDYVLIPDKGAIAFIASVNIGYVFGLNNYSNRLYKEISSFSYGHSIGDQIKRTVNNIQGSAPNEEIILTSLGMTLEGDPSLIINSPKIPDISISDGDIIIDEADLNLLVDSIDVKVVLTNIGKYTFDPFEVELIRQYPSGLADSSYTQIVNGIGYKDTLTFTIPLDFINAIGLNVFDVFIDLPSNSLEELDDFGNNSLSTAILISEGSVLPGYPYNLAIVGENNISLKASTGDPFEVEKLYRFEIDTTHLFSSGFFLSHEVNQSGGVLEWDLPFELTDSTVYYWRISVDSTSTSPYQWNESSFQYIEGQDGWSQADFHQFEDNQYNNLDYNTITNSVDFISGSRELKCIVNGGDVSVAGSSEFRVDGEVIEYSGCQGHPALHVAVIDPLNLEAWGTNFEGQNPDHEFGQFNQGTGPCRSRVEKFFIFQQHKAVQMDSLVSMLQTKIPDDHYLLIYTWKWVDYDLWNTYAPELFDIFTEMGATEVGNSDNELPFIFITKKGSPESTVEIVGDFSEDYIEQYYDLDISGNSGRMRSSIIGPALSWDRLWWDPSSLESANNDVTQIHLQGITETGATFDIPTADFDGDVSTEENLIDHLNSEIYPYLKLESNFNDSLTQTPAQIDAWHVNYGVAPEAALNPQLAFSFQSDTIQEGANLKFTCAIENISKYDMDSLKVNYWVENNVNEKFIIDYPRQDSLKAGEALIDTILFNTTNFRGLNKFWVEINPYNDSLNRYDQKEQYHFNNIAHLPFIVTRDLENPILDVRFDGINILDGEMVSAKPNILISLDDENPFLLMNEPGDTAYFSVFLTDPNGLQKRINFQENDSYSLTFTPAIGVENISKLEYNPDLTFDGQYNLLVIASDKTGNASGDINYDINFEVDHVSRISEVLNYPNPFSTKTHFVFTLSGEVVPDYMKIQIMTITGKVVKTIFKEELGPIRVGRNITDYYWDGRDDFGDQLANGVYLYRVTTKYQGESFDNRETNASSYFKKGFGKMYLMR